ncbi:hypothetical protein EYF80_058346 [Liparis tanakae]|uniref:Uncharacterized protein n=1 Tax=Liparis tanakae TaxID=230148 RepID=A0A4Z2ESC4_9TELE|nr:hypothetical protein EYF80_058346 [Liparis tanakae]
MAAGRLVVVPLSESSRLEGGMAAPRSFLITVSGVFLLVCSSRGSTTSGGSRRATQERCGFKVNNNNNNNSNNSNNATLCRFSRLLKSSAPAIR